MSQREGAHGAAYRPDIDGLRAVAVLSVVLYHANMPGFSGGFVGVDVFFVISGYLITGIIWRELHGGGFSLANFYARRVKRIFPALSAVLAVGAGAAFFLLIPSDLTAFGKSLNATVLFYSNFHFLKLAGYFDGLAIDKPLLHTWSLSVEEQFYAVWPILFCLMARVLPARRLLPAIISLAVISFVLAELRMITEHQKDAFYLSYYRGWELLIGAALAIAPVGFRSGRFAELASAGGLAAIVLAVVFYDKETPFPGMHAILPCAGAALIVAAGGCSTRTSRLLSLEPVRFVGLISYSLYLIHWPLFSFAHLYLNDALPMFLRVFIVLASILLSFLSWRYIETPVRRAKLPNAATFLRAAPAAGLLYCIGAVYWLNDGLPFRVDGAVLAAESTMGAVDYYSKYCRNLGIAGVRGGTSCEVGDASRGAYDFVIWGDSHAYHYVPAIDTLAKARNAHGVLFARSGCPPFLDDADVARQCRDFNAEVIRWVRQHHSLRLALLGSRWAHHRKEIRHALARRSNGDGAGALSKTMATLNELKVAAVILDQVPDFNQNVPICIARARMYGRGAEPCLQQPAALFLSRHKLVEEYFDYLKGHYDISIATPFHAVCDGETCRAVRNAELLLRDDSHLSEAGALYVMPHLNIPGLSRAVAAGPAVDASNFAKD